ncbi:MAG TPA: glycosyltransferase, partial [Smithellaceae bacterium]|nr:glycosyltransferase [Smithellaceae bacterium]
MQKKTAIIISPNYKDHSQRYLRDCLESLRRQDWQGGKKIFIADNQSTAESFAFLKETAPEAEIIRNKRNDG